MLKKLIIFVVIVIIIISCGEQTTDTTINIKAKPLVYTQDGKQYEGFIAYDKTITGKMPGILLIHEWTGLGNYVKNRARQIAKLGYVAFAMDMYGRGIRANNHEEAGKLSGFYKKDRKLMLSRVLKALSILKSQDNVLASKIAAIGYCFGGGAVLELALSGSDISGVVSFHGSLFSPNIEKMAQNIKTKILIHHGDADKFIKQEHIKLLKKMYDKNNVNYKFIRHPGAVHAFTRPSAGGDTSNNIAYNEEADKKSWKSMVEFLKEIFS